MEEGWLSKDITKWAIYELLSYNYNFTIEEIDNMPMDAFTWYVAYARVRTEGDGMKVKPKDIR